METVNTSMTPCWRCQSVNTYAGALCEICGANLNGESNPPPQHQPVVTYPRGNNPTTVSSAGMIQTTPGTHPVWAVVVLAICFGGWAGMLVNRQYVKAIIYGLLISGAVSVATCGLAAFIFYPLTVIDAILVSLKMNRGQAIREWEFF